LERSQRIPSRASVQPGAAAPGPGRSLGSIACFCPAPAWTEGFGVFGDVGDVGEYGDVGDVGDVGDAPSSILDLCFLCFLAALIASSVEGCRPFFGPSSTSEAGKRVHVTKNQPKTTQLMTKETSKRS